MKKIDLPQRPAMGAVIVGAHFYDEAKRQGFDMTGYIRAVPIPLIGAAVETRQQQRRMEREGLAARKKLAQWAQRGGK